MHIYEPTILKIQERLLAWYDVNCRSLPWRESGDPYRIWVSEVMLQQTQVKTAWPYYERFVQQFPTVESLARSDMDAVLKLWQGLGYYARARNLHRAAGVVVSRFNGRVPRETGAFLSLSGVGPYIAAAVLSIAFDCPLAAVDGNVKRVLARLFTLEFPVNHSSSYRNFQKKADQLLDHSCPGRFNQAVMELGALVCTPGNPRCTQCPLSSVCRAFQTAQVATYPRRNKTRPVPTHHVAVGVIEKNGKLLITRRKPDGLLGGLWEFPGGKVKQGEEAAVACVRELFEETGLRVAEPVHLTRIKHAYTHFKIEMDVYRCRFFSGTVQLNGPVDYRWIAPAEIAHYPFPRANLKFTHLLMSPRKATCL